MCSIDAVKSAYVSVFNAIWLLLFLNGYGLESEFELCKFLKPD